MPGPRAPAPISIGVDRLLEGLEGLGKIVLFVEQPSPGGFDHRVHATACGCAEQRVGILRAVQRPRGASGTQQRLRVSAAAALTKHAIEVREPFLRPSDALKQQSQLQRGFSRRRSRRCRLEQLESLVVLATPDREARQDGGSVAVAGWPGTGEGFGFVDPAVGNRSFRAHEERLVRLRRDLWAD